MGHETRIARTASGQALQQLMDHLSNAKISKKDRESRATQALDTWLGKGSEADVIARGRRLIERDLALPPAWHNMRLAVANRLVPQLENRSGHFKAASELVKKSRFEEQMYKSLDVSLQQMQPLIPEADASCITELRGEINEALSDVLMPQMLTFMYAANGSPRLLQSAMNAQAFDASRMSDVILDKFGPLMQSFSTEGNKEFPPLTEAEAKKLDRVTGFIEAVNPGALEGLEGLDPAMNNFVRRDIYLLIANTYTPEELDRIEAFYRTDDGKAYRKLLEQATATVRETVLNCLLPLMYGDTCNAEGNESDSGSDDDDNAFVTGNATPVA